MLFARVLMGTTSSQNSASSSSSTSSASTSPSTISPFTASLSSTTPPTHEQSRCPGNHDEHTRCPLCMDKSTPLAALQCTHGKGVTCPRCIPKSTTGTQIAWLCNHPPGIKCLNCLNKPSTSSSSSASSSASSSSDTTSSSSAQSTTPCSHPKTMVCPKCINSSAKESTITKPKEEAKKNLCNHEPGIRCIHCLPKEPEMPVGSRPACRRHGPHGFCNECLERMKEQTMKLKLQEDKKCTKASVLPIAIERFQQPILQSNFEKNRFGWLYGTFGSDNSVKVDVIYEPPQEVKQNSYSLLPDPDQEIVDSTAKAWGLTKVGLIFSHVPRPAQMIASDIEISAKMQNEIDYRCVTIRICRTKSGKSRVEAIQVSEQAMKLQASGQYTPLREEDPISNVRVKSPVIVEGLETFTCPIHFFLVNIPIISHTDSIFAVNSFPIENRFPQRPADVVGHLANEKKKFPFSIADFHLILYLVKLNILNSKDDLPAIYQTCAGFSSENLQGYKEIIEAYIQSMQ
eukprot:TRINITY_DN7628_c0_g1_i2.p1 TRINITY_DN7628_c0_g1~~TRINITY_DN7628_c0_g1_i2.p1  ORF type:complete len:515 (-),score=116.84 TRINITY_DN7628_c0_g1_i2:503-2047(-)